MKKKIIAVGITAAFLLGLAPSTYAFSGNSERGSGPRHNPEVREAMQEAIKNNDYNLVPEELAEKITEEKFNEIVAKKAEREAHREAVQAAIEAGDYAAWKALVEAKNPEAPILEKITEENFDTFQQLHVLKQQVKALEKELGLEGKGRHRAFWKKGRSGGEGES